MNYDNKIKMIEENTLLFKNVYLYKCYIQSCVENRDSGDREISLFQVDGFKQYIGQTPLNYDFASLKGLQPLRHTADFEDVQAAFAERGLELVETDIGYNVEYCTIVLFKINKDYMLYDKDDDDIIHYYTNFSFDPHHEGFEIDELPNLCIFELDMYDMMEAMTILAMHMEFGTPTVDNAPCLPGNQDITLYLDGKYEDYVTIVFMFNNHPELDIFRVQPRNISSFIELNSHLFQ